MTSNMFGYIRETDLASLKEAASRTRLLVLGDLILDRYTWGNAERVSPEAPVLVLRAGEREVRLGGAASVASLLRGLGADVTLAGVVGDDSEGRTLRKLLDEAGIHTQSVLTDPTRPTTTKERFLGRAANRHPHQILRVDHELREPIGAELEERLATCSARVSDPADPPDRRSPPRSSDRHRATSATAGYSAVLISDYAKGVCTPRLLEAVIATAHAIVCRSS